MNPEPEKAKRKSHLAHENPPNVYSHMRNWYAFSNLIAFCPSFFSFSILSNSPSSSSLFTSSQDSFPQWICIPIFLNGGLFGILISIPISRFIEAQTATPALLQSRRLWIAEASAGLMASIYLLLYAIIHFIVPQYTPFKEPLLAASLIAFVSIWVGTRSYLRKLGEWYEFKKFKQKSKET